jgi:hypothetical protein
MIKGGIGGALTKTGLLFEGKADLKVLISATPGYEIKGNDVYYRFQKKSKSELVGSIYRKNDFYKYFLEPNGIDYKAIISKKLLPDDTVFVVNNNTLHVIECKFQTVEGSVDEKLQTCDFKNKQYRKLLAPLNIEVKYIYVLNDWFNKPTYKDVLDYIISVNCYYF